MQPSAATQYQVLQTLRLQAGDRASGFHLGKVLQPVRCDLQARCPLLHPVWPDLHPHSCHICCRQLCTRISRSAPPSTACCRRVHGSAKHRARCSTASAAARVPGGSRVPARQCQRTGFASRAHSQQQWLDQVGTVGNGHCGHHCWRTDGWQHEEHGRLRQELFRLTSCRQGLRFSRRQGQGRCTGRPSKRYGLCSLYKPCTA